MKSFIANLMSRIALVCVLAGMAGAGENVLWDKAPAEEWTDAYPVGNGQLGAMVFGKPDSFRVQFNGATVWKGRPHSYGHPDAAKHLPELRRLVLAGKKEEARDFANKVFMAVPLVESAYQPCGDLFIAMPALGGVSEYRRALDMPSGMSVVRFTAGGTAYKEETFTPHGGATVKSRSLYSQMPV